MDLFELTKLFLRIGILVLITLSIIPMMKVLSFIRKEEKSGKQTGKKYLSENEQKYYEQQNLTHLKFAVPLSIMSLIYIFF